MRTAGCISIIVQNLHRYEENPFHRFAMGVWCVKRENGGITGMEVRQNEKQENSDRAGT